MAGVDTKNINVDQLRVGMFVSKLDRPWIETPFPLQGFYVKDLADIDLLKRYCRQVLIDVARSRVQPDAADAAPAARPVAKKRAPVYPTVSGFREELRTLKAGQDELHLAVNEVYKSIQGGGRLNIQAAHAVCAATVDSVVRNPDAMVWMARMRQQDDYLYRHALRCSVWSVVFGRHLGLSRSALTELSLGCLLMDVGATQLSADIWGKSTALDPFEKADMRRHVELGVNILKHTPGISAQVVTIVANHHERYDGSGYPNKLQGSAIPPLAKIAGIVDTYDAMISERPHAKAMSTAEAVARLYEMRGTNFQSQLVEEFIQAIGVYPTGTLVRLSSDEIGFVIEQNPDRRLRPKVVVLMDAQKKMVSKPRIIDLGRVTHDERGEPLRVLTSLLAGSYGLRPEMLMAA